MAPPPPPPPPPLPAVCFPFIGSKPKRRLSWSSGRQPSQTSHLEDLIVRQPSYSPTSTITGADSLAFHSDSEKYDDVPSTLPELRKDSNGRPKLLRSNTMTGTKKSMLSKKWGYGYGWGLGKKKEKELEVVMAEKSGSVISQTDLPLYQAPVRRDSKSSQASRSTQRTQDTHRTQDTQRTHDTNRTQDTQRTHDTHRTQDTQRTQATQPTQATRRTGDTQRTQATHRSQDIQGTQESPRRQDPYRSDSQRSKSTTHSKATYRSDATSAATPKRARFHPNDSSSTLVGSSLERKVNEVDSIRDTGDTAEKLADLRRNMLTHHLDY